ncbi:MAG: hypothetical protein RL660_2847 [Bacteroidota bacterium]|jgi:hypothetical protein
MKKVLLTMCVATALFASCSKLGMYNRQELPLITKEENVTLAAGQKITITLPTDNTDDTYAITNAGTSGATVTLEGNVLTIAAPAILPATTITDVISASNEQEAKGKDGDCNQDKANSDNGDCDKNKPNGIAAGGCIPDKQNKGGSKDGKKGKHRKDNDGHRYQDQHYKVNVNVTFTGKTTMQ